MITHVVLMKLHDRSDTDEAVRRLRSMAGQIPSLHSLRVVADTLHRPGAFDLALISTHPDADALEDYVAHPVHENVLTWLKPRIVERAVVDADG